ncbi:acetyltransferase [Roseovarius aestuariivivens]|uniref:acetyltransferase n=1 Tax=Roseovarius aestuariivivens TaxID=1888910 RepID=UPI001080A287|nr:acetyltransferase [Roseovarius aestuariivivens]
MAKVVIFGTGQFAQTVTVYLERESEHEIFGYTVDAVYRNGQASLLGKPVFAWETLEDHFAPSDGVLFGPISFRGMNRFRAERYAEGKARGYDFLTFVHPASHVYSEEIGENCLILEANTIQPFVRIGNNVVIWSGNHIGHHTEIGDHCFLTSHVGISGNCRIGPSCFFAGKSGVSDNVAIGEQCLVGAGALILRDLAAGSFAREISPKIIPGGAHRFAKLLLG